MHRPVSQVLTLLYRVGVATALLFAGADGAGAEHASSPDCGETSIRFLTARENASLDERTLVIVARGPIAPPMVEELERRRGEVGTYGRVILDLDSPGGQLSYAERLVAFLQSIRGEVELATYVRHGSRCLSSCVLAFVQGEERIAGGASAWLFHGVCHAFAELPLPRETERFIALLAKAEVSKTFLALLESRIGMPGEFWASGYELHRVYEANIITRLIDPWRPLSPVFDRPSP